MDEEKKPHEMMIEGSRISNAISQIAHSICCSFSKDDLANAALIGIQAGGVPLARRISRLVQAETGCRIEVGSLDITMYRDDFGTRPALPIIRETEIPFDINGKIIILTDDVLQSGRSVRAALDALTDFGRPGQIRLAALIDRGQREYPIHADFVGETVQVEKDWRVCMDWVEFSGTDCVYKIKR